VVVVIVVAAAARAALAATAAAAAVVARAIAVVITTTTVTTTALLVALGAWALKLVVLGVVIAVVETRVAKLRLFRVPELLSVSFVLALLATTSSFLFK